MTNEIIWEGRQGTNQEVDAAISAARSAAASWASFGVKERMVLIKHFQTQIEKHKKELALCISKESGKPLWESHSEVLAMTNKVALSMSAYEERSGTKQLSQTLTLSHKPHGVVAVFGPYNFPAHLPNSHIIPALIAGNTIVYKGSEHTPSVSQAVMHYFEKARFPNGVINLLQGEAQTGQYLALHPDLNAVFFTGSARVGALLHSQFAAHVEKLLVLEMGGNNPLVVSKVENEAAAALITIQSAYLTAGQRCTCARRLIIINNDRFVKTLIEMIRTIHIGDFRDQPEPFFGPVINLAQKNKLLAAQENLIELGGKALLKMKSLKEGTPLLSCGLIDMTSAIKIPDIEYFGPLLQLITVSNLDEAIAVANDTQYGLSATLLSSSEKEFTHFFNSINAGVINWNEPTTGASSLAPFGGVKRSGNFRPSAYYAADYCAYPVTSKKNQQLDLPQTLPQGISWMK